MASMFTGFRISLANKCQLLFGAAVVVILFAALLVVAHRMQTLVERGPRQRAQLMADAWLDDKMELDEPLTGGDRADARLQPGSRLSLDLFEPERFEDIARQDPFLARAIDRFQRHAHRNEVFQAGEDAKQNPIYRYARAIRASDLRQLRIEQGAATQPTPDAGGAGAAATAPADPLKMVLVVQLRDPSAATQTMINHLYLVAAGLLAGLLAIGVFWFITTRLILSPVRVLRDYAEQVYEGDLNIRSDINTGDEFEQLSDMFNAMLAKLKHNADQLESINKSLDLKLGEMAESNVALYEANKMKGQFLANVSHELRTPLNSVIGFAEVLQETVEDDGSAVSEKRRRYVNNIITSSRRLLDLITELLDLAKLEAGRMEVRPGRVSIADTVEGLINLIRPQAEAKSIKLESHVAHTLPMIETDPGKLQQILFNLLANAVKFTPENGRVTLAAYPHAPAPRREPTHVCFEVADTGPGIDEEDQQRIFEQFTQLQSGLDREQGGTGLGLTISRELAHLLKGRIELDSIPGRGTTFRIILPITFSEHTEPLMPAEEASTKQFG
jgi:signal transduction histidine kinase